MSDQTTAVPEPDKNGWSLLDVMVLLGQQKKILLAILILGSVAAVWHAMSLPRYYSATTMLLPPQQQTSAAGALSQLGFLAGAAGVAGIASGLKTPEELYVAFLQTRRLQNALIERLDLKRRYGAANMTEARQILAGRVSIVSDKKTGLITLEADDQDAVFSASLANAYVEELRKMLATLAVTESQQRQLFFEQQVNKTRAALGAAEMEFRRKQGQSGLVVTQAMAESLIRGGVELHAQIAAREVQLQALSRFATEQNPDVQRLAAELSARRHQLALIERGNPSIAPDSAQASEAVQAFRTMKIQEITLEALVRQLEIAKVDASKEGPLVQAVDQAIVPERMTKSKRRVTALVGILAAMLLGVVVALIRGLAHNATPETRQGWSRLKAAWR
ncbi:MAG: hypothetical protein EOP36_00305 [Rubrivivax sp.]|nr:MAG: hypothetical protein EOP36_00305 [Rubrivivax sp.]